MKRIFKYMGFAMILMMCFFYTEKTALMVKDVDYIMLKIRTKKEEIDKKPIEATLTKNTIIPGISGYEIDINKSYQKMRYIGKYNDNYLEYKKIEPKETLLKNIEKTIVSGNITKNQISIVLVLKNDKYIDFVNMLDGDINVFTDGNVFENNQDEMQKIKNLAGTIGYNYNYDDPSYVWLDNMIKKFSNSKHSYCLMSEENDKNKCSKYGNFAIYSEIIKSNPLLTTKANLKNGKILVYEINDSLLKELGTLIKFINGKGYTIVKLDELLKE